MKAEVVAIGSELTSGAKLDTNSQWLSLELANLGIPVAYHTTMADSLEAMTEVFRIASGRCNLVLITGGLGPTLDDITRDALAALAGVELVLDTAAWLISPTCSRVAIGRCPTAIACRRCCRPEAGRSKSPVEPRRESGWNVTVAKTGCVN